MNIRHDNKSPHHTHREMAVRGVVIHYTGGPGAIAWFCDDRSKVSAHYVITRDGTVHELVPPSQVAYHVGVGEMEVDGEMRSDPNDFTVGIELDNHGCLHRDASGGFWWGKRKSRRYEGPEPEQASLEYDEAGEVLGWWEPYPEAQLVALEELLEKLGESNIVGHEEVAMPLGRKRDPGPLFPWGRFKMRTAKRRTWGLEMPKVGTFDG